MAKTLRPTNQKSLYASAAAIYERIMNGEISATDAEQANKALEVMNRTFALEIKNAETSHKAMRIVESTNFEE